MGLLSTQFTEAEIGVVIEKHRTVLYTAILHKLYMNFTLAEDITQDAILKIILALRRGKYVDEGNMGPWMIRIGTNLAVDYHRKSHRVPSAPVGIADEIEDAGGMDYILDHLGQYEDTIEDKVIYEEQIDRFKTAIDRLPIKQKAVMTMRIWGDKSFKEIAEEAEVSINTALGRMRYALINIHKMLSKADVASGKALVKVRGKRNLTLSDQPST